jgi:Fur family peroxide stress response transcriptional regulator
MEDYNLMLRGHNLKATPQRIAILESIQNYGHINIDKLYEEIKKRFESISLATIYKNINAMTKNMLLSEVKIPNEKSVYEIVKEKHSHLACKKCGSVTDVDFNIDKEALRISKKYNFDIDQSDVVFSGTCENCKG